MELQLREKRVFVTGSTKGIGFAIAKEFASLGARVIVHGRSQQSGEPALNKLKNELPGGNVTLVIGDLSKSEGGFDRPTTAHTQDTIEAERVCEEVQKLGELDVLVCNMGVFTPVPFEQITDDQWGEVFNANVLSTVRPCRVFLPKMLQRNAGSIVIVASEAGIKPVASMIHYSVTKGAQITLARGLAEKCKGTRVRVNSVLPGPTLTEGVEKYFQSLADAAGKVLCCGLLCC